MILTFKPVKPAPAFESIEDSKWNSWIWQMQNTLNNPNDFDGVLDLSSQEKMGFEASKQLFKIAVTPYYASLARSQDGGDAGPIRRIMMPQPLEADTQSAAQEMNDPLAELEHGPVARIIHRYSDRVLFLITDTCSVYCRFCTRKRFTASDQGLASSEEYQKALNYIKTHPGIREVILSGGDPLTLSNKVLGRTLADLRAIPHVEIIRIGSRMPVVNPMRVDKELALILRANAPVFFMSHFSHPLELTEEAKAALTLLVDNGVPVLNQMVLLNGVNNHPAIVQALSRRLLYLRVKPYYMFQCDPSEGTDHLRTTVEHSEEIVRELWGHLSGIAMPALCLDIPSGGGKTNLAPNFMTKNENGVREFTGWDKRNGIYRDPKVPMLIPSDVENYQPEWDELKNAKNLTLSLDEQI